MIIHKSRLLASLLALSVGGASAATAGAAVLFDPGLGTAATSQGWLQLGDGSFTFGLTGQGLLDLDTSAGNAGRAGYFSELPFNGASQHPVLPQLDRNPGFRLDFSLQVLSETHDLTRDDNGDGKNDRAGFSVIALAQDLFGLELAFFQDRVWAYEDATPTAGDRFTQAESAVFDTTAALIGYSLTIADGSYALRQNGSLLLSGGLRKYTPSGVNPLIDPYDNPSFLFFGDDTTSARSHVQLGRIAVAPVPLPPALALFATSLLILRRRRLVASTG